MAKAGCKCPLNSSPTSMVSTLDQLYSLATGTLPKRSCHKYKNKCVGSDEGLTHSLKQSWLTFWLHPASTRSVCSWPQVWFLVFPVTGRQVSPHWSTYCMRAVVHWRRPLRQHSGYSTINPCHHWHNVNNLWGLITTPRKALLLARKWSHIRIHSEVLQRCFKILSFIKIFRLGFLEWFMQSLNLI